MNSYSSVMREIGGGFFFEASTELFLLLSAKCLRPKRGLHFLKHFILLRFFWCTVLFFDVCCMLRPIVIKSE